MCSYLGFPHTLTCGRLLAGQGCIDSLKVTFYSAFLDGKRGGYKQEIADKNSIYGIQQLNSKSTFIFSGDVSPGGKLKILDVDGDWVLSLLLLVRLRISIVKLH